MATIQSGLLIATMCSHAHRQYLAGKLTHDQAQEIYDDSHDEYYGTPECNDGLAEYALEMLASVLNDG